MDFLEEGNLFLQALNAPLQVQPGQSGTVNILQTSTQQENAFRQRQMTKNLLYKKMRLKQSFIQKVKLKFKQTKIKTYSSEGRQVILSFFLLVDFFLQSKRWKSYPTGGKNNNRGMLKDKFFLPWVLLHLYLKIKPERHKLYSI